MSDYSLCALLWKCFDTYICCKFEKDFEKTYEKEYETLDVRVVALKPISSDVKR